MPWEAVALWRSVQVSAVFDPKTGLPLSIGCNRKLQSDSRKEAHPIDV